MLKNKRNKFLVLSMLVCMFTVGGAQEIHASRLQINTPKIVCMNNLGKSNSGRLSKKQGKNRYKNIRWEGEFFNKDIINKFARNSKEIFFGDEDGSVVKKLRRKMFMKKIMGQVLEFFINEF